MPDDLMDINGKRTQFQHGGSSLSMLMDAQQRSMQRAYDQFLWQTFTMLADLNPTATEAYIVIDTTFEGMKTTWQARTIHSNNGVFAMPEGHNSYMTVDLGLVREEIKRREHLNNQGNKT
jgi:hypothetical protein